jgi:uncharacterized low-complexity protein
MRHLLLAASTLAIACGGSKPSETPSDRPASTPRLAVVSKAADKTCADDPCGAVRAPAETLLRCEKAYTRVSLRDRFSEAVAFVCTFGR